MSAFELGCDASGVEHGQFEQVLDQPIEVRGMPARDFEILLARAGIECIVLDDQRLYIALHGCERGAQVVGDVGDQFAAQPVVFLQCGQLLLNGLGHAVAGIAQLVDFIVWLVRCRDRAADVETASRKSRDLASEPAQASCQVREQPCARPESGEDEQHYSPADHALPVAAGDL